MGLTVHMDPLSTTLLLPQARSRGQKSSGPSRAAAGVASAGTPRDGLLAGAAGGPGFLDVEGVLERASCPPLSCTHSYLVFLE